MRIAQQELKCLPWLVWPGDTLNSEQSSQANVNTSVSSESVSVVVLQCQVY